MKPPDEQRDFEDSPDYLQSLHRGLEVIRAFSRDNAAMTLTGLAQHTDLSRAVVRRVLLTLQHLGYVARHGREFSLSPRILELGFGYLASLPVAELALPFMEELTRTIHESCSLSVLDDHDIVYVQRVPVRKVMTISLGVGARLPAFCTSMGRVLVAGLDENAREQWLQQLAPVAKTRHTLVDPAALRQELRRVRTNGYAYLEQELEEGLCALAVPLRDRSGSPLAALNSGMAFRPGARARALREILPALQATAQQIERSLPNGWRSLRG